VDKYRKIRFKEGLCNFQMSVNRFYIDNKTMLTFLSFIKALLENNYVINKDNFFCNIIVLIIYKKKIIISIISK